MIPKTIHYCWFGRKSKPKLAKKCIKSWKKHCKDYKIIEWNEDNFDISSAPIYVRQAYEAKKWAFVTDYVRLFVMVKYGGIYMDTDVEVIKPLDYFLKHKAFSGFENETQIQTAIMACEQNFPLFKIFLDYYYDVSFFNQDGTINYTTNVSIITDMCLSLGLKQDNSLQVIDGFVLYPRDYFCPIEYYTNILNKTKNTATIHHFSGSWKSKEDSIKRRNAIRDIRKINLLHTLTHIPNKIAKYILGEHFYSKLKSLFK